MPTLKLKEYKSNVCVCIEQDLFTCLRNTWSMPFFVAYRSCPKNEDSFQHIFGTFQVVMHIWRELDRVYRPCLV
jgi:hypothetical protein